MVKKFAYYIQHGSTHGTYTYCTNMIYACMYKKHQTENNQGILLRILCLDIDLACLICQWSRLPEPWEVAFLIATALILAIINLLIWKFVLRNSSTMNRKLQLFTKHKASDEKRITKAKMEKSVGGWFLLGSFFLIFFCMCFFKWIFGWIFWRLQM